MLDGFLAEVRALAEVGVHDNIVAFYGVAWDVDSYPSIVLEFVAGGELVSYISSYEYADGAQRGLENPTLMSIALGIIEGVMHIHSRGMLHRDLKPQNILLYRRRIGAANSKIADFGESRDEDKISR